MKREVQLYISDTKVDLFQDETISITDSIQNISDISKVFTPFSKSFNLPASSVNNKLFKHYYNFNIQDGFDARFQVTARLEINQVPFRSGKIRLDGVSMKNNQPFAYKVVFFGEPSSLNDLFGSEDLSSLNGLSTYDIDYSGGDFLNAFKTGLQTTGSNATSTANRNIVVPLILLENYYTYDTPSTNRLDNVNFSVLQKDLKPAIKLKRIIEAIQTQYDISFNMTDDGSIKTFFGSDMFDELYLWLHRENSPISAPETDPPTFGVDTTTKNIKRTFADYTYVSGGGDYLTADKLVVNSGDTYTVRLVINPSITNSTGEIIVKDKLTNELLYYKENVAFVSGVAQTITITSLTSGTLSTRTYDLEFRINCNTNVTFAASATDALNIAKNGANISYYSSAAFTLGSNIFIQDYLPKIKVIDFLSGLFKMFNLVAYTKLADNTIYVETFDDYMTKGVSRDITKYIDINTSTIDRPVPFNQVNFKYSAPVTQTSLRFINQFSLVFGDLNYSAPEKYDGQAFNQELPFERSVLINLINNAGVVTNNVIGWWVDAEGKSTLGSPYIFFNRVIDSSSYPVTNTNITAYNAPSNVSTDQNHTLNFGAEYDEFNGEVNTNSLFSRFYQQYIVQTFEQNGRIIKVSANLPISFMLNYSVNDIIVINAEEYYINSINMNLATGKSQLELIVKKATYTNSVLT
tara:strand:+ start:1826 stop:3898 length:2073 start_codon:yes stop_codon:yes gene_type:complete